MLFIVLVFNLLNIIITKISFFFILCGCRTKPVIFRSACLFLRRVALCLLLLFYIRTSLIFIAVTD